MTAAMSGIEDYLDEISLDSAKTGSARRIRNARKQFLAVLRKNHQMPLWKKQLKGYHGKKKKQP